MEEDLSAVGRPGGGQVGNANWVGRALYDAGCDVDDADIEAGVWREMAARVGEPLPVRRPRGPALFLLVEGQALRSARPIGGEEVDLCRVRVVRGGVTGVGDRLPIR